MRVEEDEVELICILLLVDVLFFFFFEGFFCSLAKLDVRFNFNDD